MVVPPQQRLYFFPEPHGHGSFLPILLLMYGGWGSRALVLGFPWSVATLSRTELLSEFCRCVRNATDNLSSSI